MSNLVKVLILGLLLLTGCNAQSVTVFDALSTVSNVTTAHRDFDTFSTLVTRLSDTSILSTVFAPSNAALSVFINSSTAYTFEDVLLYSIVDGSYSLSSFTNGQLLYSALMLPTLADEYQRVKILTSSANVLAQYALVTDDISASNGHVLIVDNVLLPPENATFVLGNYSIFTTLTNLINIALTEPSPSASPSSISTLSPNVDPSVVPSSSVRNPTIYNYLNAGETTIFAPTDHAFLLLDPGLLGLMLQGFNQSLVVTFLEAYIVPDYVFYYYDLMNNGTTSLTLTTLSDDTLTFSITSSNISINTRTLILPEPIYHDILTSGGAIQSIDNVWMPSSLNGVLTVNDMLLGFGLTSFISAMKTVGLTSVLFDTTTNYTFFPPPNNVLEAYTSSRTNSTLLRTILDEHIVYGRYNISDSLDLTNANGNILMVNMDASGVSTVLLAGSNTIAQIINHSKISANANIYPISTLLYSNVLDM